MQNITTFDGSMGMPQIKMHFEMTPKNVLPILIIVAFRRVPKKSVTRLPIVMFSGWLQELRAISSPEWMMSKTAREEWRSSF